MSLVRLFYLLTWQLFYVPVYFATPLNVISSIIVGSERPFAFTANKIIRYELPGSKFSMKNATGGR